MSADNRNDRIAALSKRFAPAEEPVEDVASARTPARTRGRHTFYLDSALVAEIDRAYRDLAHDLYPRGISKSEYLEALLSYGLGQPDRVKATLLEQS